MNGINPCDICANSNKCNENIMDCEFEFERSRKMAREIIEQYQKEINDAWDIRAAFSFWAWLVGGLTDR